MYKLIIHNISNDEKSELISPIIPNISDYICINKDNEKEITKVIMRDFVFKDGNLYAVDITVDEEN